MGPVTSQANHVRAVSEIEDYISREAMRKHSTTYMWEGLSYREVSSVADQWDYATGAADPGRQGYESKKQKAF